MCVGCRCVKGLGPRGRSAYESAGGPQHNIAQELLLSRPEDIVLHTLCIKRGPIFIQGPKH